MKLKLDAVALIANDVGASVAFYQMLGLEFTAYGEDHFETTGADGQSRLMIDSTKLFAQLNDGVTPARPNHSVIALLADSPADVDATAELLGSAGYALKVEPWDAFWGQRYMTAIDPDGYLVDVFAAL